MDGGKDLSEGVQVFIAVRYGDSMGLPAKIPGYSEDSLWNKVDWCR